MARAMARRSSLSFDDATQEATIGLIRAADHFDETRNTAFSTYARYWITESLQLATIRDLPIHVPVHVAKASFAKFKRSLAGGDPQTTGDQPANDSDGVNQKQEIPRLCRGDSRCLTYSGVHRRTDVVSRQAHNEGGTDGRGIEPKAQQVGVQISRSIYSEVST